MFVTNIILDTPLAKNYSYLSESPLTQGTRVIVDFNHRRQVGFVAGCISSENYHDYPLEKLKPLLEVSMSEVAIPREVWQLCNFTANYYHHSLGSTIFCALPTILRKTTALPDIALPNKNYYQLATSVVTPKLRKNTKLATLWQALSERSLSYEQIYAQLGKNPTEIIANWQAQGLIETSLPPSPATVHNKLELNAEQTQVVAKISQQLEQFHTGLLYGITGSGKTEVFLHLIEKILQRQKQVLVLVPEINLTPQMSARFAQRFPYAEIMQLNSEVSDKQRLLTWMSAKNGSCQIVLGTRLSIFTPFANLGMIIVDEEHDDSFKQSEGLRYHARDLAVWRAKQLNIPILLASATPSLESLYNYQQGKYQLYKLTARANPDAVLPQIELINLQHFPVNHAGISNPSIDAIAECLQKKEIALVFINRRGYAPIITCYECGWVSNCRNCSSKMVYHHNIKRLRCHHCGYSEPIPTLCPICRNQYLHTIGHGTQKLEEFLQQNFPAARIRRVDRDTTSSKKSWHTLYQEINAGEVDILVGTQMLAKGHDFAKLTLVIGLNLDNALFSYDYRASEDMFNGLTQIAGRAGRAATPGKVLLQTNYSGHPLYQFLQQHDFNGFVNYTLKERHENKLPPFSYSTIIRLSSNKEKLLKEAMQQLRELLAKTPHAGIMLFPPQPAVMYKLHNKYRAQLAISAAKRNELHAYLNLAAPLIAAQIKKVTIAIDVDPIEI